MTTSLGWLLIVLAAGSHTKTVFGGENCEDPDRLIVCHVETTLHPSTDPCYCTHLVIHNPHDKEIVMAAEKLREKNRRLKILSLSKGGKSSLLDDSGSGVYLKLSKTLTKEQVVKNVKTLATELDNFQASKRASAKYTPDNAETVSKNVAEILLELPSSPELLAKNYDLKSLNKFVNYFIITSDNLTDSSEEGLAYHPSRLMGIDDILNADSLVDLISGLGAEHEKLLISLPATALKFNLKDKNDNMPRAKVTAPPETISQEELCSLIENGLWTLERDEDLTAPYAYSNTTWLAFDDSVSAAIKAKYILLRGLAGISVTKSESDDWSHACASRPILDTVYGTFTNLVRKPRAATLLSLQDQIHNSITPFAGDVQLSPYRIVRVVDRAGSVHVVRKEAKTEFQCSRQGYFTHPSGCNRFYRCVKFNQYSSDFTVFEYDCPAGLAFDERYEVCVWPGSLPDASACKGSSEIAPVPRSRFACSGQGYFADPENCRWFFACLDHQGDGSPPTAYEFRCPFGLVFNEGTLTCDWPWSVPGCGSGTAIHSSAIYPGDILEGRLRPAYAQVSDVHVSGGRIANVDGGHVLGTNLLSGISDSGQRYSTGYSLGLASQINSAFGSSQNEDNSGAYVHDPTGDTGGEYIHQEGPQGPGSSYSAEKDTSYLNAQGALGNNLQYTTGGQYGAGGASVAYLHDSRGDVGGQYAHIGGSSGSSSSYVASSGVSGGQYGAGGASGAYIHDSRGDVGGQYAHVGGSSGSLSYGASSGTSNGQYTAGGASGAYVHDSRGDVGGTGGSIDSSSLIGSSGASRGQFTAGDGLLVYGTKGLGLDNAGAYVHDSSGDVGGLYAHIGGSSGSSSSSYVASSGVSGGQYGAGGASGAYIHDSRGDVGGQYAHIGGSSGSSSSYVASSGVSGGQYGAGGASGAYAQDSRGDVGGQFGHIGGSSGSSSSYVASSGVSGGQYGAGGASGAYIHDSRGDVGGHYAHIGGSSGSSSSYVASSGVSGGQYGAGGASGAYIHDSRGDVGGQYAHIGGSSGSSSYEESSGSSGGQHAAGDGILVYGTKNSGLGNTGAYIHDSRGDVGGQYAHIGGSSGSLSSSYIASSGASGGQYAEGGASGAYVHDSRGDSRGAYEHQVKEYKDSTLIGGVTIENGQGYLSNSIKSQNLAGIGGYSGGSYSSSSASGEYNHDSRGDSGGEYIHQGGPSYYGGIYAGGYAGHHIHGGDGAYVHDTSGDSAEPYIHGEGPSGPLYQDLNSGNLYESQYASKYTGQYASKYFADYDQLTHHDNVNSAGTIFFQPQGGVIHTYDSSKLHAQPLGYVESVVKPYQQTVVKTQGVSPINIAKFSGAPLNPVQYLASVPHAHPIQVSTSAATIPVLSHEYNVIKTQTISPLTVSTRPSASYGNIQPINSVKTHLVQPIKVSTPQPILSYEQPGIRTQTVRPITVTSSPVIPFNSIQYQHPFSVLKTVPERYESHRFNTISPPIIKTHSVQPVEISQPVQVQDNSLNYQQRIVSSTPSPPAVSYQFNEGVQTGTVRPITVTSAPAIPFNPVQYGQKTVVSTPYSGYDYSKPKVTFNYPQHIIKNQVVVQQPILPQVGYSYHPSVPVPTGNTIINQPVIKTNVVSPVVVSSTPRPEYISYKQPVVKTQSVKFATVTSSPILPHNPVQYETRAQTYGVTTPASLVIANRPYNPIINTVHPVIVASTPTVPLSPVQYGVKTVSSSVGYHYTKPAVGLSYPKDIIYSTQAPPVISYTYQKPVIKTQPIQPVLVSTPAQPVVDYSYEQSVKPARPFVSYSQKQINPAVPIAISTPAPPVVSYSVKTRPIQPIIVSSTPAIPLNPVQYVNHISVSTPAPQLVSYSYQQPIKPAVSIAVSTPAPPVVSYSYQQPIKPAVPIAVSTPAPPVVSYSYQQPIKPAVPIAVSTPAPPVVSYSYEQPSVSPPAHPVIYSVRAKPIQPIVVSSTPVVPLNPVQYISTPAPPLVSYSHEQPINPSVPIALNRPSQPIVDYSYTQTIKPHNQYVNSVSISPPSPPLVSYSYQQPIKPAVPVSFRAPALPDVNYSYKQPIVPIRVPAQPAINYSIKTRPIQPIVVSSTPSVPLSPVQYVNPITISTPAPHLIDNSYRQPIVPISVSTPSSPTVSYSYQQPIKPAVPVAVSTSAPPAIRYSINTRPIQPIVVSSTPAVPLNPVQYVSTPAPPLVSYSHEQPIHPSVPIAVNRPSQPIVDYSYTQTIKPVLPSVNYAYQQPIKPVLPSINYSYQQPIKPTIHYAVTTTASPPVSYSIKAKPIHPIIISSTPSVPLNPVQYINPASVSTPAPPVIDYSYQQPVKPAPFSFVHSVESNRLPSVAISSTPAPPVVNYSYQKPIPPVVLSTPTPFTSYSFKAKPVQSITVSSTPAVPLNPIQYEKTYSTPVPPVNIYSYRQPVAPISVSTPSPIVNYSYENKLYQPISVTSTPVIPLNPVQYVRPSTPAPPTFEYSYKQPVKNVIPSVTYSTHATPSVDYSYDKSMEQYAVNKATNVVFSYTFDANQRKPVTVSSTPAIPLNPVQYSITPAPAVSYQPTSTYSTPVIKYSYRQPVTKQPYQPAVVTSIPKLSYTYQEEPEYFLKTKTARPISVTRTPIVPLNPVQYFSTTTPQPTFSYKYQSPVIKTYSSAVAPSSIDYYDEELLHRDIVKLPAKPVDNSFYEVPTRTTTLAPITVTSTPRIPYNPVQYYKTPIPLFNYKYEIPQGAKHNSKGCCSSPSLAVTTPTPDILKATISPPARKPVVGAYFEENYEANRHDQGYIYSRPNIRLEERPLINQGIYTTVSPSTTPAEITSTAYLQRPVQTYANTVEEESYISNTPDHVSTLVNQPVSVDTSDEDLNVHLDIPKIGISRPAYTISNAAQQQVVEVTTVTPVVKRVRLQGGGLTKGGYYVRRQKVKVQPVLTTTENYPAYFTSSARPIYSSTIDLTSPTLYSTTFRPSTVYSTSSTTLKDNELELEDVGDDEKLLAQVSGQFGDIINAGNQGIIRQGFSSTTVSSLKDGEAIVGVVKKERTEGGRKKTKVVVVSKLSDFNPLLVGKLGAECSCKSNSKTLNLQRGSSQTRGQLFYPEEQNVPIPSREYLPSSSEQPKIKSYYLPSSELPNSDTITSTTIKSFNYENEPFVEIKPVNKVQRLYTTTGSSTDYISAKYDLTTKKSTFNNRIGISQENTKGASFDRYGPGGLRGSDETLQGSVDCQRPGLFRHPKYCNKFYACNWDQWKKRFTLHVFNCPIHLAYDSQLGACNWPSKGPACADDNLLV